MNDMYDNRCPKPSSVAMGLEGAQCVKRSPRVRMQIDSLSKAVDNVYALFDAHANKLQPILSTMTKDENCKEPSPITGVPIADVLYDIESRINRLARYINETSERVEV